MVTRETCVEEREKELEGRERALKEREREAVETVPLPATVP